MQVYKFGSLVFTIEEIRETGRQHGISKIVYYPPQSWGGDSRDRRSVKLGGDTTLEAAYQEGYKAGYYEFERFCGRK